MVSRTNEPSFEFTRCKYANAVVFGPNSGKTAALIDNIVQKEREIMQLQLGTLAQENFILQQSYEGLRVPDERLVAALKKCIKAIKEDEGGLEEEANLFDAQTEAEDLLMELGIEADKEELQSIWKDTQDENTTTSGS